MEWIGGTIMADRQVQRRLATVLAADVAGYSRLMDADQEGTYAIWRKARTEIIDPRIPERTVSPRMRCCGAGKDEGSERR